MPRPADATAEVFAAPRPPYRAGRLDGGLRASPDLEWLLPIGNGGFAMGTASGLLRRKYHGLLIASTNPPVERFSALAALDETLVVTRPGGPTERFDLFTRRSAEGTLEPRGYLLLRSFEKAPTRCTWIWRAGGVEVIKELMVGWRRNQCAVRWTLRGEGIAARLEVLPRVTMRDFHVANARVATERFKIDTSGRSVRVTVDGRTLALSASAGQYTTTPSVAPPARLDFETERAQDDLDAHYSPGRFEFEKPGAQDEAIFVIGAALAPDQPDPAPFETDERAAHLKRVGDRFTSLNSNAAGLLPLVAAADDFLAERTVAGQHWTTILAGFPWFADWGRDTMISLNGLLLAAGRHEDAFSCLRTFASHVSEGMIPNHFDDYGGPPHYNTVDASLWFIHACHEYLARSRDEVAFRRDLLPACLQIVEHYQRGTRFNIRMDPSDGLIAAGDEGTQLTWMDAKRSGIVFTPRHGKPVEISALWFHALLCLSESLTTTDAAAARRLHVLAGRAGESFRARFWNEKERRLHDCLREVSPGRWEPLPEIRPNQIFAVSLAHSPLEPAQQRAVVENVRRHLLTPFGLRTLAPGDPNYEKRFDGDMMSRDRAYHNGTVWPWLFGPYAEAVLRVGGCSAESKAQVRALLAPLLHSMNGCCLGQIAEVFDAEGTPDRPQRPQGCVAQAWSIAEILRVALLAL